MPKTPKTPKPQARPRGPRLTDGVAVLIDIERETLAEIDAQAAREGITRAAWIRGVLAAAL